MLAVAAGIPVRHRAIGADVLNEGHEGADSARPVVALPHGHRPVPSDWFDHPALSAACPALALLTSPGRCDAVLARAGQHVRECRLWPIANATAQDLQGGAPIEEAGDYAVA